MKLLLDTHVFLWSFEALERLPQGIRTTIEDRENTVFVSVATAWEITIKYELGKLRLPVPPSEYVASRCATAGFDILPIQLAHATSVANVQMPHRDPFDRILVAQAAHEGLHLITLDARLAAYALKFLPAEALLGFHHPSAASR